MKGSSKNLSLVIVVALLGFGSLFTPLRMFGLAVLILLAALLITFKSFGFLTRSILVFALYTCLVQIIGFGFWKLDIQYTFFWSVAPLYTLLGFYIFNHRQKLKLNYRVNKQEVLAFSLALVSVGVIFLTTFWAKPEPRESIRYIARGFDNATHLTITDAVYKNQGYVYGDKEANTKIHGIQSYPQGWHLSSALLWRGLPTFLTPSNINSFLFVYIMTILLWYFIFIFAATLVLLKLISTWNKDRHNIFTVSASVFGIMLFQAIVGIALLKFGFSNFIATLAYLLLLALLSFELAQKNITKQQFIAPAAFLSTGIAISWLLAAPIGYLIILGLLVDFDGKASIKKLAELVFKNIWVFLLAILILAFGFIQGFVQILYSTESGTLNLDGGIWNINQGLLAVTLTAAVFLFYKKNFFENFQRTLLVILLAIALPTGFIYYLQYHTMARTSYYYEKVAMVLLAFTLLVALALGIHYIAQYYNREGSWKTSLLVLLLVFSTPLALGINTSASNFAFGGDRKLSKHSADQLTELIANNQASKNNVLIIKGLDYEEDNSTTNFIKALSGDLPMCNRNIISYQMSNQIKKLTDQIKKCAEDKKFYIITSGKYIDRLEKAFEGNKNIELILSS